MGGRRLWHAFLELVERPLFQGSVVAAVLALTVGALLWTQSAGRPAPETAPPTLSAATEAAAPTASTEVAPDVVAGPPAVLETLAATSVPRASEAASSTPVAPSATPPAAVTVVAAVPDPGAVLDLLQAGSRVRIGVSTRARLSCSDAQLVPRVLTAGTEAEVVEVGTGTCAGWVLVRVETVLSWLLPSALASDSLAASEDGR